MNSNQKYSDIIFNVASVNFESLRPDEHTPFRDARIKEYMALGPFVLETDGAFETEYFYEREKLTDHDYLTSSGGEAEHIPYIGKNVKNEYYGPANLTWQRIKAENGDLRFSADFAACQSATFATQQRNCLFYAAVYVDCKEESRGVLCYENSGSNVYLNGTLIDTAPYGRVKGMRSAGRCVAVRFSKGRNLLMFKIRTGYIADGIDICMPFLCIYPFMLQTENIGVTAPLPTGAHFGTHEKPLQIFQSIAASFGKADGARLTTKTDGYENTSPLSAIPENGCMMFRVTLPAGEKPFTIKASFTLDSSGEKKSRTLDIETTPAADYDFHNYLFSDFHFDTTYHQEQRVYALGAFHITKCLTDKLIEDPDFKSILSEVDYLHPYYSIYPKHREAIRQAFIDGRAEADCFYNQPNDLTSSGEGFVRNLIYGQLYHRDVLGRITPVFAPGDVFGHPNQMTQMCLKGGCRAMRWGKRVVGLDYAFRHISPDGTIGLHDKCLDKYYAHKLGLSHGSSGEQLFPTVPGYPSDGKTGWMKDTLDGTHYAVFSELLDGMLEQVEEAEIKHERKIDITSRDLTQHHSGVLLTRTDFKQANRLAENLLTAAEKFSFIAAYYGAEYPEKALDKAWRQLLCAQHHDSVTGTNNEVSFVDLMIEYRETLELAAECLTKATAYLAGGVKIEDGEIPYFIFNSHEWERKDCCEISVPASFSDGCALSDINGKTYPVTFIGHNSDGSLKGVFTPSVPALGYATYILKKADAVTDKKDSGTEISNEFYTLRVSPELGGGIVSLFDKKAKRELVRPGTDGPANRVVILKELNDRMETQHEFYTTGHKMYSSDYKAEVTREITETFRKLTITVQMDIVAKIVQEITLYKGVKRIDMRTTVEDYQGRDDLFTLTFPINLNDNAGVIFDDRYAPHIWAKSQRKLSFQTHQFFSYSHSKIAPVNQWIELGKTLKASFTDSGKLLGDINIGMTALIRRPELYSKADILLTALSKKAVPVTPYSDTAEYDSGKVPHFNEDLDNTDTRFVLCVEGDGNTYTEKLLDSAGAAIQKKFALRFKKNGISLLYTKDSDNIYNKNIDVILIKAANSAKLEEFLVDLSAQLAEKAELTLDNCVTAVTPGNCDDYGVALINTGNISCTVEPDNLMNMMLFHTANFYGNSGKVTGDREMIPEQKTHSFSYALYPHSGDYREGDVYKKAFEFNDRLSCISAIKSCDNACLPKTKSFVSGKGSFLITALKPAGEPLATMHAHIPPLSQRGMLIRGFETTGLDNACSIKFSFDVTGAESVNLLEEDAKKVSCANTSIKFISRGFSIDTYRFSLADNPVTLGKAKLGAEKEPVEPTYVRSWEHDLGSMNMGYLSVAGIIGKDIERIDATTYMFNISMANNHPDAAISGKMKLKLPKGFTSDSDTLDYSVQPRGIQVFRVKVKKPSEDANGIIRLEYAHDGQKFEDLFEFGYYNPDIELKIDGNRIIATVFNNTNEDLHGEIALATPFETWNISDLNRDRLMSIEPRTMKFDVKSGKKREYEFTANIDTELGNSIISAYWAAVKLMANGRIHFAYAENKGTRHNYWTHHFSNIIYGEDRSSLERLLKI